MPNPEETPANYRSADETATSERRREVRYPLDSKVRIRRQNGDLVQAQAVNISASGLGVYIQQQPCPLALDEEVTIEVELPGATDKPFSAWGLGRVAYLDAGGAGIQLYGGHFDPPPIGTEG
jgi:hypothetical protein